MATFYIVKIDYDKALELIGNALTLPMYDLEKTSTYDVDGNIINTYIIHHKPKRIGIATLYEYICVIKQYEDKIDSKCICSDEETLSNHFNNQYKLITKLELPLPDEYHILYFLINNITI